jgi:hypothetical protein
MCFQSGALITKIIRNPFGGSRDPALDSRAGFSFGEEFLFLRIRHVRKIERLASLRQRDPCIPQARIMFALLGIVCFLRQPCALRGRFHAAWVVLIEAAMAITVPMNPRIKLNRPVPVVRSVITRIVSTVTAAALMPPGT